MVKVDIIVPTHVVEEVDFEYITELVGSIVRNTPRELYSLTFVIDRGWNGTEKRLRDYQTNGWVDFILYNTSERGFTRTCNVGLEQSEADLVLLLNMDIVVSPGWLERLVDCAERTDAGVVGCKLLNTDGTINHAGAFGVGQHKGMNEPNLSYFEEEEVEWVTGAAFLIAKKVREKIGNLNEYYPMWGSDRDYCLKAKEAGFSIWYCPVELLHYGERSTTEEIKKLFKDNPR